MIFKKVLRNCYLILVYNLLCKFGLIIIFSCIGGWRVGIFWVVSKNLEEGNIKEEEENSYWGVVFVRV